MALKELNKTQVLQLTSVLAYYKYFYICNDCGTVYGSDKREARGFCHNCSLQRAQEEAKKNGKSKRQDY